MLVIIHHKNEMEKNIRYGIPSDVINVLVYFEVFIAIFSLDRRKPEIKKNRGMWKLYIMFTAFGPMADRWPITTRQMAMPFILSNT